MCVCACMYARSLACYVGCVWVKCLVGVKRSSDQHQQSLCKKARNSDVKKKGEDARGSYHEEHAGWRYVEMQWHRFVSGQEEEEDEREVGSLHNDQSALI